MRGKYIDLISSYCDRWCERCPFTERCSVHAVEIALEMCDGNAEEALELAIGEAPPRSAREARRRKTFAEEMASIPEPTAHEMREFEREEEAREERIQETSLQTASQRTVLLSRRWLKDHREHLAADAALAVTEALDIAGWDSYFIAAKVHRAQRGLDEAQHERRWKRHKIQNDWNGSAKVALISITRSIAAWDVIAEATGDPDAAQIAAELRTLQAEVERAFPNAWKFRRPGFDGVQRWRWW